MPDSIPRRKQQRHRLEVYSLRAAAWLIERLPFDAIPMLGDMLGTAVYHLDRRGRETALANLKTAFGDLYGPEEREQIARGSFQNFARTMLCLFWSPNLTPGNIPDYVRVDGTGDHPVHRSSDVAGVYFLGHYSNFEWLSLISAYAASPGLVITQGFKNEALNPIFDKPRGGSGHTIIARERAIVRMLKFLKKGGKVGAAIDLSIDPRLGGIPVRCFGLWTPMSPMATLLAKRGHAWLVPSLVTTEADDRYRITYQRPLDIPPEATDQEIAQMCWDVLEKVIRERPELWLWSYKQWRFRPSGDTTGRYPAYSNVSKRFDKLLNEAEIHAL